MRHNPLPADDTLYRIAKVDDDEHLVFGFASVIKSHGLYVIDRQDDVIEETELSKAAHGYMLNGRGGKVAHAGKHIADPVESLLVTKESSFPKLLKALNIAMPDTLPVEGWWIGLKVSDPEVWKAVKSGRLSSFSIGGTGERHEISGAI